MRLLLALGLAALACAYVSRHHMINELDSGGPMDGTVWEVRVKPDSWFSFSHKDTLVFDAGRMTALHYMASGFSSATYAAAGQKGKYSWQASFQRANNETLEWTGHIQDDHMAGDIVQHDASGRMRLFHFKGSRKLS